MTDFPKAATLEDLFEEEYKAIRVIREATKLAALSSDSSLRTAARRMLRRDFGFSSLYEGDGQLFLRRHFDSEHDLVVYVCDVPKEYEHMPIEKIYEFSPR